MVASCTKKQRLRLGLLYFQLCDRTRVLQVLEEQRLQVCNCHTTACRLLLKMTNVDVGEARGEEGLRGS